MLVRDPDVFKTGAQMSHYFCIEAVLRLQWYECVNDEQTFVTLSSSPACWTHTPSTNMMTRSSMFTLALLLTAHTEAA